MRLALNVTNSSNILRLVSSGASYRAPNGTILSSFAAPSASTTGITFDGTNLISCDYSTDIITVHDGVSSTILSSFAAPATNPRAVTFDGANLISCDANTNTIYVHDGVSSTILSSFATSGTSVRGLTFDGTNLISCDFVSDLIYIHDGVSSTILSSFAAPGSSTLGLAFDGTNLISCDSSADLIYIHDGVSSTILSSFAAPGTQPYGLAFDGTNLISCDLTTDLIYIHDSGFDGAIAPTSITLKEGIAGTQQFVASGGLPPYTYTTTGTLPGDMSFTVDTATWTDPGLENDTYSFTIKVTDNTGDFVTQVVSGTVGSSVDITNAELLASNDSEKGRMRYGSGWWSDDGGHLYTTDWDVETFHLTSDLDLTSMNYENLYSWTSQKMFGVAINSTGTTAFIFNEDRGIRQLTLNTPYSLSGTSTVTTSNNNYIKNSLGNNYNLFGGTMSRDGQYIYTMSSDLVVHRYTLATPFVLSSIVSLLPDAGQEVDLSADPTAVTPTPWGLCISHDGRWVHVADRNADAMYQWKLSTPYDLSTIEWVGEYVDSGNLNALAGMASHPTDASIVYALGQIHGISKWRVS
jgi:hypothetical protein